jgi:hypothetical protein
MSFDFGHYVQVLKSCGGLSLLNKHLSTFYVLLNTCVVIQTYVLTAEIHVKTYCLIQTILAAARGGARRADGWRVGRVLAGYCKLTSYSCSNN